MNGYGSWWTIDFFIDYKSYIHLVSSYMSICFLDRTTYETNNKKWLLCEIVGMTLTNHNFLVVFYLMKDGAVVSYTWVLERLKDLLKGVQTYNHDWSGWGIIFSNSWCISRYFSVYIKYLLLYLIYIKLMHFYYIIVEVQYLLRGWHKENNV